MSAIDDMLKSHALAIAAGLGSEAATYKPVGGPSVACVVQVWRGAMEALPGVPTQLLPEITAFIPRSATAGATSININGDILTVPVSYGGTAVDQLITQVTKEDAGGFTVKLSH